MVNSSRRWPESCVKKGRGYTPLNRSTRNWLEEELPNLVTLEVVPNTIAEKIRDHYGYIPSERRVPLILLICGTLGAVLISLGIILLFAHNWDNLSRPLRAALSFTPLIAGQLLLLYTLLKKAHSDVWRESTCVFTVFAIGACIALISQTYQIPGDLGNFLLVWSLLGLPLVYLAQARLSALLYLAGITTWSIYSRGYNDPAVGYWFLFLLLMPYIAQVYRKDQDPYLLRIFSIGVIISLLIGTGFAMDHTIGGMWILTYPTLLAAMYFFGAGSTPAKRPYAWIGTLGTTVLLLMLTFSELWKDVVRSKPDLINDLNLETLFADCAPALFFALLLGTLVLRIRSSITVTHLLILGAPIIALVAFMLAEISNEAFIPILLCNIYMVIFGNK